MLTVSAGSCHPIPPCERKLHPKLKIEIDSEGRPTAVAVTGGLGAEFTVQGMKQSSTFRLAKGFYDRDRGRC